MSTVTQDEFRRRYDGKARNGQITLRDFDVGVTTTLGATLALDGDYYLKIDGILAPPGDPGIQVLDSFPEDTFERYRLPLLVIRREDFSPAMSRWHPGSQQYRAPAPGAIPVKVFKGTPYEQDGFHTMETQQQAVPFDINYTVMVYARHRGAPAQKHQAGLILHHAMKVYQPYSEVRVTDSLGDVRPYQVFMDGVANLDAVPGVVDRIIGHGLNLRVEGELDLNDPEVKRVATSLTIGLSRL